MNSKEIIKISDKYLMHTYKRFPIALVSGKGALARTADGKIYLDFFSGLAVNNLGHCHPAVVKAIHIQAGKLMHTSNLYYTVPAMVLAKKLIGLSFPGKVFFCNSGAEANEAAIKLCRKWGNPKKNEIITMKESFHGRTVTTVTATGQTKYQKGFDPLAPGFKYSALNDIKALRKAITNKTTAIMIEPIQGEGGVNVPDVKFIKEVRALCNKKKILLIFDEVQTGIGRTGKMFAYQYFGVKPDILTLAKAIGGGLPLGITIAEKKIAGVFEPGMHASTFGGNPVTCAAANAVLDTIKKEKLLQNANKMGSYLVKRLNEIKKKSPKIKEVRGKGLMIGVELKEKGAGIVKECMEKGLLINCTAEKVLRIYPPLNVKKAEIDKAVKILKGVLTR